MEAFQLLARGGAHFDKKRFKTDVERFSKTSHAVKSESEGAGMPNELDFFKYAEGGNPKRKNESLATQSTYKKRKIDDESDSGSPEETIEFSGQSEQVPTQRHRVTCKGNNVPEPADTFKVLADRYHLSSLLLANLSKHGYSYPTGIQSQGVPILLESRDLAAISPTGTGKTLSYLLPIVSALRAPISSPSTDNELMGVGVRAIILAPTKELAHQIHNECLKLCQGRKWRIVLFSKATANTLSDIHARDKVDLIISTPLRLVASLRSKGLELNKYGQSLLPLVIYLTIYSVRHLILDEADRMLDPEFLPQVQEIVAACTHSDVQKAVFSATLPAGAEKTAMEMLRDPIRVVVGMKDTPLPLIAQSLTYVADDPSKLPSLLTHLAQPYNPPILIFTSTQPRATDLAQELVLNHIPNVDSLHAGMTNKEREDAVSRMRRGESWVMVSTEVMARGMDFKGVREVINYDFPTSVQSYIHRIGRTGRAGKEGKAVTFFTDEDGPYLKSIANVSYNRALLYRLDSQVTKTVEIEAKTNGEGCSR
ncbi:P-loop containing nucleoside triphosphate hydrolase protein [Hymenopellis radicata]|nr:P-loop containing nucleoside triphosphate hydrolase protein [Hymenopellis radicata]